MNFVYAGFDQHSRQTAGELVPLVLGNRKNAQEQQAQPFDRKERKSTTAPMARQPQQQQQ